MFLLLLALPCAAVQGLPPYLPLPGSVELLNADALITKEYGEAAFSLPGSDNPVIQRGKHWSAGLRITGLPEETEGKAIWARIKPVLLEGGWSVPAEFDANPFSATLRYQKDGKDVWGVLTLFGTEDLRLNLIEIKAQNINLALKPPAATPEKVSAVSGDFPYLPPLPGSTFMSSSSEDGPMLVTPQGSEEPQAVG